ncbi:hypothetical protein LP415_11050 [Polaromonas sp. P1(28)-8]|nr:hypothetical protein LP415_11050 [Polaromonas sp. P1(28)-8]
MFLPTFARRAAGAALLGLASLSGPAVWAAPYTPANDSEVVERLPGRASDPAIRRVESLRRQLAARPDDTTLRVEIARRYFDLAMAQGDPATWATPPRPSRRWPRRRRPVLATGCSAG